tara:strand:+ start:2304 stop:2552 length:249 start_codon:yes stop_codon:yes gene_type:complete
MSHHDDDTKFVLEKMVKVWNDTHGRHYGNTFADKMNDCKKLTENLWCYTSQRKEALASITPKQFYHALKEAREQKNKYRRRR